MCEKIVEAYTSNNHALCSAAWSKFDWNKENYIFECREPLEEHTSRPITKHKCMLCMENDLVSFQEVHTGKVYSLPTLPVGYIGPRPTFSFKELAIARILDRSWYYIRRHHFDEVLKRMVKYNKRVKKHKESPHRFADPGVFCPLQVTASIWCKFISHWKMGED